MFSIMCQKNGYNRNPTSRIFRSCFANICSFSLMKCSELCNCEEENDDFFIVNLLDEVETTNNSLNEINICIQNEININSSNLLQTPLCFNIDNNQTIQQTIHTLESCSIIYFVGYLVNKCLLKFKCEYCEHKLLNKSISLNNPQQLLILNKTYEGITSGGLKMPTCNLINICKLCLNIYEINWHTNKYKKAF